MSGVNNVVLTPGSETFPGGLFTNNSGNDSVRGTAGNDSIVGGNGNDTVWGDLGNDTITGDDGNDSLFGSHDDDSLSGGANDDTLRGGAGNDTLDGGIGSNWVSFNPGAGAGGVTLDLELGRATGEGSDRLFGIQNAIGGSGNDSLLGSGSGNILTGGLGNDTIDGAAGDDSILGIGEGGNSDLVFGGAGDDTLAADTASGGGFSNTLDGGSGSDSILADSANESIFGGEGADTIIGGFDSGDTIDGGTGSDFLLGGTRTAASTTDFLSYASAATGITAALVGSTSFNGGTLTNTISIAGDSDTVGGFANFIGTGFSDFITVQETIPGFPTVLVETANTMLGGAGDDTIFSGGRDDVLYGEAGNDLLQGGNDNDSLFGGVNNDTLQGGTGDDWLEGGENNDQIFGDDGRDTLLGDAGDDSMWGGRGNDSLVGGDGVNWLMVERHSANPTIVDLGAGTLAQINNSANNDTFDGFINVQGGTHIDSIFGDSRGNILDGGAREDYLVGRGGDDWLRGGTSFDGLEGGIGNDTLDGGSEIDRADYVNATGSVTVDLNPGPNGFGSATGADGNDLLTGIEDVRGSNFDDRITGDSVANRLEGMGGNDTLSGGAGADSIINSGSGQSLEGGAGADFFLGAGGTMIGGVGEATEVANQFRINADTATWIIGGGGSDLLDYRLRPTEVTVDLNTAAQSYGDTLGGIVQMYGTAGNDFLTGDDSFNALNGFDGDDTIDGRGSNDRLFGGYGNDSIVGGSGDDKIFVGDPDDQDLGRDLGNNTVNGGTGNDFASYEYAPSRVTASLSDDATIGGIAQGENFNDSLFDIEGLIGSTFNDSLTGNSSNNELRGAAGNDTLSGGAGDDTLLGEGGERGGAGNDSLLGGIGNDRLDGGNNNDTLSGGAGNDFLINRGGAQSLDGGAGEDTFQGAGGTMQGGDTFDLYQVTDGGPTRIEAGAGNDLVDYGLRSSAVTINLATGVNSTGDTLNGIIQVLGSNQNDFLTGNDVFNILNGGFGNDTLDAGDGGARLFGSRGNDSLFGGNGHDTLFGDPDDDTLRGGTGNDFASYEFATGSVTASLSDDATIGGSAEGAAGSDRLFEIEGLIGGNSDDRLTGNSSANTLDGGGGNDALSGGAGADSLAGGAGNDTLEGGADNDTLDGGAGTGDGLVSYANAAGGVTVDLVAGTSSGAEGEDRLFNFGGVAGGANGDLLRGSDAANVLLGNAGNDTLEGRLGDDTIIGGTGSDFASYEFATGNVTAILSDNATIGGSAEGAAGLDRLFGIEGLIGGNFNDVLAGNSSANTLLGGGGNDELDGGAGNDWVSYAGTGAVTVNLGADLSSGALGNDKLARIENALGSDGADSLLGDTLANILAGGLGHDTLAGGLGDDTLDGGTGNDFASYATANDTVRAFLSDDTNPGVAEGTDGSDQLFGIEGLIGGIFNDSLTGNSATNTLMGGDGSDSLFGGGGNDWLDFGAGNDRFDWIQGVTTGNLTLIGGGGNDFLNLGLNWSSGDTADGWINYQRVLGSDTISLWTQGWDSIVCFAEGTRIVTPNGEDAVENLRAGDMVLAMRDGQAGFEPLRWVGFMDVAVPRNAVMAAKTAPILIKAGALAPGMPARDLRVSPDHAMEIDGHLIPAKHLVNGSSIIQEVWCKRVRYFHLELEAHGLLLSEGTWSESYLDDGNRHAFNNAALTGLYLDFEAGRSKGEYDHMACLPVLRQGLKLDEIHGRIALRAEGLAGGQGKMGARSAR